MHAHLPSRSTYDAVIVGGRCAGAATALLLARAGARVLVVERSAYGSDTLSTHALMRTAVLQLSRWGVLERIVAAGTPAIRQTSFHYDDDVVDIAIKPKSGVGALYAPRRTVLDMVLVEAARAAGAEICHGARVAGLLQSRAGRVCGATLRGPGGKRVPITADIVIGADGVRSTVARTVGAAIVRRGRHATATVYAYFANLPYTANHWYYRDGAGAGVIPTNDDQVLVCINVDPERFRSSVAPNMAEGFARVLSQVAPGLAVSVDAAARVTSYRGDAGIPGYLRSATGPGWALVGDAGYFKDPITAHGIADALRDAELLARGIAAGTDRGLRDYETLRNDLSTRLFEITDDIASMSWKLDELKALHIALSEEMNREAETMLQIDHGTRYCLGARTAERGTGS